MNTEITDGNAEKPTGWVFYDGECAFCRAWVRRLQRALAGRAFQFATMQSRRERTAVAVGTEARDRTIPSEMLVGLPNGHVLSGADAGMAIARHIWWLWPLWLLSRIPGAMILFRAGYRQIARHRHCIGGKCGGEAPALKPHRHGAFFEMP